MRHWSIGRLVTDTTRSVTELTKNEIQQIRSALSRLERNPIFAQADRMLRFLHYIVEEVLAGHGDRLTQFALGIDVFDRDENFDPAFDSIVRVEASRLRNKLREYYSTDGKGDEVRFELPKGTYVPEIRIGADRDKIKSSSEAELASIRAYSSAGASVDSPHDVPGKYSLVARPGQARLSESRPLWTGDLQNGSCWDICDDDDRIDGRSHHKCNDNGGQSSVNPSVLHVISPVC